MLADSSVGFLLDIVKTRVNALFDSGYPPPRIKVNRIQTLFQGSEGPASVGHGYPLLLKLGLKPPPYVELMCVIEMPCPSRRFKSTFSLVPPKTYFGQGTSQSFLRKYVFCAVGVNIDSRRIRIERDR